MKFLRIWAVFGDRRGVFWTIGAIGTICAADFQVEDFSSEAALGKKGLRKKIENNLNYHENLFYHVWCIFASSLATDSKEVADTIIVVVFSFVNCTNSRSFLCPFRFAPVGVAENINVLWLIDFLSFVVFKAESHNFRR